MPINGFALMPSIYDRGYADALRVDYYTTCQECVYFTAGTLHVIARNLTSTP